MTSEARISIFRRPIVVGSLRDLLRPKWFALVALIIFLVGSAILFRPRVHLGTGEGDSMTPTLRDGGREIFFGWRDMSPKPGRIYLVRHGDELLAKRITAISERWIWLKGDNPDSKQAIDSREFGWLPVSSVVAKHIVSLPRYFDGPTFQQKGANPAAKKLLSTAKTWERVQEQRAMFLRTHRKLNAAEAVKDGKLKITSKNYPGLDLGAMTDGSYNTSTEVMLKDKDLELKIDYKSLGPGIICKIHPSSGSIGLTETKGEGTLKVVAKAGNGPPFFFGGISEVELWARK